MWLLLLSDTTVYPLGTLNSFITTLPSADNNVNIFFWGSVANSDVVVSSVTCSGVGVSTCELVGPEAPGS